jgi:hypothetical protein
MTEPTKITKQTFYDLATWIIHPEQYSADQLTRLQSEDECLPLLSLAHQYWLIGLFTNQLKTANVWNKLSDNFKNYLLDIEVIYLNRIDAIKTETIHVSRLLSDANINVTVMKGAASLFNGVADPISNRYMKDIDLLVAEDEQQKAYSLLKQHGYEKDAAYFDVNAVDAHHAPPLLKENLCYIELHRWVLAKHLDKVLDTDDVWKKSISLNIEDGLTVNQLSPTHQVVHCITHSEIQNGGYDQYHIDLHQLFNLYSIIMHFSDQIDWDDVQQHFEKSGQKEILSTILYAEYSLLKLLTPLTDTANELAKIRFEKSLSRYENNQGVVTGFSVIMEQLYGYKRRNIQLMYGKRTHFTYSTGVIKHVYYHLRKVFNSHHIKLYVSRMMNKA